jgi:hypothetical protein
MSVLATFLLQFIWIFVPNMVILEFSEVVFDFFDMFCDVCFMIQNP